MKDYTEQSDNFIPRPQESVLFMDRQTSFILQEPSLNHHPQDDGLDILRAGIQSETVRLKIFQCISIESNHGSFQSGFWSNLIVLFKWLLSGILLQTQILRDNSPRKTSKTHLASDDLILEIIQHGFFSILFFDMYIIKFSSGLRGHRAFSTSTLDVSRDILQNVWQNARICDCA